MTRHRSFIHLALRGLEHVCWLLGFLLVAYVGANLWFSARFQEKAASQFVTKQQPPDHQLPLQTGDVFGKILIPRIGLSAMIAEGTDDTTLRHAVGHFPESSSPEQRGNVALAGHRDTFFRPLAHIQVNDWVTLETSHGKYEYQVVHTAVVAPQHVELVQGSFPSDLTLVTCFPFHYIGQAPQRFIVQAVRVRPQ